MTKNSTIELKVTKERACLEDDCCFCEKPLKPNNIMWTVDDTTVFISLCGGCYDKWKK